MKTLLVAILGFFIAGSPVSGVQPFNTIVRNYEKREYRAGNQNWSIACTSDGLTYFANDYGLLEFDGSKWRLYEMPGNLNVRSVCVDPSDRVYVGSFEEFGYFEKDEFGNLSYRSLSNLIGGAQFHNDEIWRIVLLDGLVYFQSFSEIYVYDGASVQLMGIPGSLVVLMQVADNLYIHGVNEGLYRIEGTTARLVPGSERLASDEIKVMLPLDNERFLIGAKTNGLLVYDGKSFEPFISPASAIIRDAEINVGIKLDGFFLLGTIASGLFVVDGAGNLIDHINEQNFLNNNTVLAIHEDQAGNIWIGMDAGISYIQLNSPVQLYVNPAMKTGTSFDAILYDGSLYVGTNKGLYRYEEKDRRFSHPELVAGSVGQVWSLFEFDHNLLCGHSNGTFVVKGNSMRLLSTINGGFHFEELTSPTGNKLAVGTTYNTPVLYESRNGIVREKNRILGLMEPIPEFVVDHRQQFWGRHIRRGVIRFNLNRELTEIEGVDYLTDRYGLPPGSSVEIVDGITVFATGRSIFTYDYLHDTILPYGKLNSEAGDFRSAQKIIRAGDDNYWFIHDDQIGLFHFDSGSAAKVFSIDLEMEGVSLVRQFPNITPLYDSIYLVNLEEGFGVITIPRFSDRTVPELFIRKVSAGSEKMKKYLPTLPVGPEPVLKQNSNHIAFTFSSTSNNQEAKFRYRLRGLSGTFSEWNRNTIVEYERLGHGEYAFEVQTKDVFGSVSDILVYPFKINQVWYATRWAILCYTIALLVGFWLINKRSKSKISRNEAIKREQQRLKEQERYTRLMNEKLATENSLKSIQLANYTQRISHRNELLSKLQKEIQILWNRYGSEAIPRISSKVGQLIRENDSSEKEWAVFEKHFEQAHNNFFKRILEKHPELTQSDLKLCAFLRMNLSSKEIAPLLNIEVRSVEVRRYRLRKRMHLPSDDNLVEYILNI